MTPQLYIAATEDAALGAALLQRIPGVSVVPPESLLTEQTASPRDIAVSFFHPIADVIENIVTVPCLGLPRLWPEHLPSPLQRQLQRTALTLGACLLAPRLAGPRPAAPNPRLDPHLDPLKPPPSPTRTPNQDPLIDAPGPNPRLGPSRTPPGPLAGGGWAPLAPDRGWANLGPGAGAFRPRVSALLVAERPGVARRGSLKHRLPFVTFSGMGCGLWLAEQLENAEIPENTLYWINAYDAVNAPTSHEFLSALQPPVVIALGKLGARWCADAGVEKFEEVPDPQYWKRFHRQKRYRLLNILQEHLLNREVI